MVVAVISRFVPKQLLLAANVLTLRIYGYALEDQRCLTRVQRSLSGKAYHIHLGDFCS